MNFIKKIFGFGNESELAKELKSFEAQGTLYRIENDNRSTVFAKCDIKLEYQNQAYFVGFYNLNKQEKKNYFFPTHEGMNLITFTVENNNITQACFEWNLDATDLSRIGCHMDVEHKIPFQYLLCHMINQVATDKREDPADFCEQLKHMPLSINPVPTMRAVESEQNLGTILTEQIKKEYTKVASTGRLYYIRQIRTQINPSVVFCIQGKGNFTYFMCIYDSKGQKLIERQITASLNYQANFDRCQIKWLDVGQQCKIIEILFDKIDAILNIQMAIQQCLYEINTKKRMVDVIEEDDREYFDKMMKPVDFGKKIVNSYTDTTNIHIIPEKPKPQNVIESKLKDKEYQKYQDKRAFCQAKIANCSMVSLANSLEMLVIGEDNHLKSVESMQLYGPNKEVVIPNHIIMFDMDSKALISAQDKNLYSLDVNELKIIEKYTPSKDGLMNIVAERKLAELGEYNTFLGVSENAIYRIDPRIGKTGLGQIKTYAKNAYFNQITSTTEGHYAIGAQDGSLRLYQRDVKDNAKNKYPGMGDPVRHLENTKDGRWLLATYDHYLILLPTSTQDDTNLYSKKTMITKRPVPKKLQIKVEHLRLCKMDIWRLLPAKFDESKDKQEKFIVSGFDQYVIIWSLSKIVKGDTSYTFAKTNDPLTNAEFKFNNVNTLIMTTPHKVKLQENQLSK